MDTLIKTIFTEDSVKTGEVKTTKATILVTVSEFLEELEANRYAIAPMLLAAMACLGGIAAAFAVQQNQIELMAVAVSTACIEVLVIALAPMRLIITAAIIAFLVDLFVFIF